MVWIFDLTDILVLNVNDLQFTKIKRIRKLELELSTKFLITTPFLFVLFLEFCMKTSKSYMSHHFGAYKTGKPRGTRHNASLLKGIYRGLLMVISSETARHG